MVELSLLGAARRTLKKRNTALSKRTQVCEEGPGQT